MGNAQLCHPDPCAQSLDSQTAKSAYSHANGNHYSPYTASGLKLQAPTIDNSNADHVTPSSMRAKIGEQGENLGIKEGDGVDFRSE
jgi:hypothetical protein